MSVRSWIEEFSYEHTLEIIATLGSRHASEILDEPTRKRLSQAISDRDIEGLLAWDVSYSDGLCVTDLIHLRQALGFYQKNDALDIGIDKEAVARETFLAAERKCRETNALFLAWTSGKLSFPRGVDSILHAAQRKIQRVLGRVPALSELDLRFGPGSTTSVTRKKSCAREKLSARPSCSANFLGILPSIMEELPMMFQTFTDWTITSSDLTEAGDWVVNVEEAVTVDIHAGKLSFVPKNAKTFRSVMTEPTLNSMVQGGYGRYIADRLRRVGQDVRDQTRNKSLARVASLTGALATLDLSSASDTISKELVAHLLPYDWYSALDSCRTASCTDRDDVIHLEKFSSMGNGFTFPLQTLIFWALVSSAAESERDVSVYGDDILCPVSAVPAVLQVFNVCGFTVNTAKSYWSGPFRESCGGDYYLGVSIRPHYIRGLLSYEKLFGLHNFYMREHREDYASLVLEYIPEHIRLWGPDGYGDGHLIKDDWPRKQHRREYGWGGWLFDTYKLLGNNHSRLRPGDRVLPAYSVYVRGDGEPPLPLAKTRKGVPICSLPGTTGYKQIQIYTLTYA